MKVQLTSEMKLEFIPEIPRPRMPKHLVDFKNCTKRTVETVKYQENAQKLFDVYSKIDNIDSVYDAQPTKQSRLTKQQTLEQLEKTKTFYNSLSYRAYLKSQQAQKLVDEAKPKKRKETNTLGNRSKKRIRQILSYVQYTKKNTYNYFITLTFPKSDIQLAEKERHKQQNSLLSIFLENLRKNYGVESYLWVAEIQDGKRNNYQHATYNLHYHVVITSNKRICVVGLNIYWLRILERYGYEVFNKAKCVEMASDTSVPDDPLSIQLGRKSHPVTTIAQRILSGDFTINRRVSYSNEFSPKSPLLKLIHHPVDMEIIDSKNKLKNYLTKYVTKNNQTEVYGRVWGCTRNYSRLITKLELSDEDVMVLTANLNEPYKVTRQIGKNEYIFTYYDITDKNSIIHSIKLLRNANYERSKPVDSKEIGLPEKAQEPSESRVQTKDKGVIYSYSYTPPPF